MLFGSVTITLWLSLSLIRVFELILRENNVLATMMTAVKTYVRNRKAVIIAMPLLIGMLPSLGGAYFSAPMVKEATSGLHMSKEEKAYINYWFRHPWEYILPLYPGILLASAISGIPLYSFVVANLTYALVLFCMGFFYSMRTIGSNTGSPGAAVPASLTTGTNRTRALLSFVPVMAVLLLVVLLRVDLHYALLIMIIPLFIIFRHGLSDIWRILRHGFALDVVFLILGIMLFKETMEATGSVRNLSSFFVDNGIPVLPIVCLLPFLTGLLTGLTVGFVGSTFPLIISITGASLPVMSMAFAAGFIGVLISPVHLCLVLTREYFKADMWGVYKKIIPSSVYIFLAAFIQYMLLR
jgi:integral membrane protein (TIGR00529 family)